MSQENVEIVRRAFDAFSRGELIPEWDADVIVVPPPGWPEGEEPLQGLDEWSRQAERLRDSWESAWTQIDQIESVGDRVVTGFRYLTTGKGLSFETPMGAIHTLHDGTIVHVQFFPSHLEALEAAGLRE